MSDPLRPARGIANGIAYSAVIWAIIVVIVLATISHARAGEVLLPPARYDFKPNRPVEEIRMAWYEIDGFCRAHGIQWQSRESGGRLLECAIRDGGWFQCVLMRGRDADADEIQRWRRHCWGHVNGWPADHPEVKITELYALGVNR